MPTLSDAEPCIVAEVVTELAKYRGTSFDKAAKAHTFARAALIGPAFKARLAEIYPRPEARRATNEPPHLWRRSRCSSGASSGTPNERAQQLR